VLDEAHGGTGRPRSSGFLERHARLRRSRQDRDLRHALSRVRPTPTPMRIVLMSHGRIVADVRPPRSKRRVGGRIIRATLPDVDLTSLQALRGSDHGRSQGRRGHADCSDSDATLRDLLTAFPQVSRHRAVRGAGTGRGLSGVDARPRRGGAVIEMTYLRLRSAAHLAHRDSCCSPLAFPLCCLSRRRSAQGRDRGRRLSSPLLDDGHDRVGIDGRVISTGAYAARARRRLDEAVAHHALPHVVVLQRQDLLRI